MKNVKELSDAELKLELKEIRFSMMRPQSDEALDRFAEVWNEVKLRKLE